MGQYQGAVIALNRSGNHEQGERSEQFMAHIIRIRKGLDILLAVARRALQSIVIVLDESETGTSEYTQLADANPETIELSAIRSALFTSGLCTAFSTRPYGRPYSKVPQSNRSPCSIFVSAAGRFLFLSGPHGMNN